VDFEKKYKGNKFSNVLAIPIALGSAEEEEDLLEAYRKCKGDMFRIIDEMPVSTESDETRYRRILDAAIQARKISNTKNYGKKISERLRKARKRRINQEAEEAAELARELGIDTHRNSAVEDGVPSDLAQLIKSRQQQRIETIIENLEKRYCSVCLRNDIERFRLTMCSIEREGFIDF
jgi:DnaJ family protein C protein 9